MKSWIQVSFQMNDSISCWGEEGFLLSQTRKAFETVGPRGLSSEHAQLLDFQPAAVVAP